MHTPTPDDSSSLETSEADARPLPATHRLWRQGPGPASGARRTDGAARCDGNHGAPRCADPDCWNDEAPAADNSFPHGCPTCGAAFRPEDAAPPAPEAPSLDWQGAPRRTEWGVGMMEASLALGPDHTLRLYAEADAVHLVPTVITLNVAPPAPPAPPAGLREFVARVAAQKPEKPDHWSSCGQCERNASEAEDLLGVEPTDRDLSAFAAGAAAGLARAQQPPAPWPVRGARVDVDTVVILAQGRTSAERNAAARWLCGEVLRMKELARTARADEPADDARAAEAMWPGGARLPGSLAKAVAEFGRRCVEYGRSGRVTCDAAELPPAHTTTTATGERDQ